MIIVILPFGRVAPLYCMLRSLGLAHNRYLVQKYDKDYHLWSRDLEVQMEMTAWVFITLHLFSLTI